MRALLESLYREHRQAAPPDRDPAAYVFAAVRNAAVDQLRRHAAAATMSESIFETRAFRGSPETSPDGAAEMDERDRLVRQAVDELPEAQREAVVTVPDDRLVLVRAPIQ